MTTNLHNKKMTSQKQVSIAEIADRHRRYMALAMLALGFVFLSKTLEHFASSPFGQYLDTFQLLLVISIFGFLAPVFFWKIRHYQDKEKHIYFSKDGYAAEALNTAQRTSWVVTFIILVFLESMDRLLAVFSPAFFMQVTLTILLCTMSVVFLFKIWSANSIGLEDGNASHA